MRRTILGRSLAVVTLVGWLVAPALAQETKSARGSVTAITGNSLTVKAGASEMKFTIDGKTVLTAEGAGTANRKAETAGKPGPKLSDFIKVGDAVEVSYHETGGALHAANVRRVSSAGGGVARRPPPDRPAPLGDGQRHGRVAQRNDPDDHGLDERRHHQAVVHGRRQDQGGCRRCWHGGLSGRRQGVDLRSRGRGRSGDGDVYPDRDDPARG